MDVQKEGLPRQRCCCCCFVLPDSTHHILNLAPDPVEVQHTPAQPAGAANESLPSPIHRRPARLPCWRTRVDIGHGARHANGQARCQLLVARRHGQLRAEMWAEGQKKGSGSVGMASGLGGSSCLQAVPTKCRSPLASLQPGCFSCRGLQLAPPCRPELVQPQQQRRSLPICTAACHTLPDCASVATTLYLLAAYAVFSAMSSLSSLPTALTVNSCRCKGAGRREAGCVEPRRATGAAARRRLIAPNPSRMPRPGRPCAS